MMSFIGNENNHVASSIIANYKEKSVFHDLASLCSLDITLLSLAMTLLIILG